MTAQPAPANLPTEPGQHAPGQHGADALYYRHVLHDLIDMGAGLARFLHGQAAAQAQAAPQDPGTQPAPAPAPDALISLAAAFDRTARAVRRSIALARSLDDPVPPARDPAQHRAAARKRILREVEDAIQRTAPASGHAASGHAGPGHAGPGHADADAADADEASAEVLTAELHDRLDAPDLDDDISHRPIAEIITEICRDLGLAALPGAHPWHRRTPTDIEQLCARAAAPSRTRPPDAEPRSVSVTPQRAPTNPAPPRPAAIPCATGPAQSGRAPPDGPAEIAMIPRHPMNLRGQWRPPPKQTPGSPHR